MQSLPSNKSNVRAYKRFLFGSACELEFDKQGRVLIPSSLRKYAELKKAAVVVGSGDHVEIWSKERWNTYTDEVGINMEELAENLDFDGIL